MQSFDLGKEGLRALNSALHGLKGQTNMTDWEVINPKGAHAIAAGVDAPVDITVRGSTGYYCAGMNKQATIRIKGSAGPGAAASGSTPTCGGCARGWARPPRGSRRGSRRWR